MLHISQFDATSQVTHHSKDKRFGLGYWLKLRGQSHDEFRGLLTVRIYFSQRSRKVHTSRGAGVWVTALPFVVGAVLIAMVFAETGISFSWGCISGR